MALRHHCKKLVPAAALAVAMAIPGVSLGQLPDPQTAGGVEYVTGGFGANMSQAFREAESDYPLALTFAATDEGGGARPYVAEVHVVIRDESGGVVMEVPSAGPYFFARLKPGRYTVEATYMGRQKSREVTLREGGTTREVVSWERP